MAANYYPIYFADPGKFSTPILVVDGTVNSSSTSITFIGRNYQGGYGQKLAQDSLNMLENFASSTPPQNPIEGQLWFDTSDTNNKKLKVNDGAANNAIWSPVNGVHQQPYPPSNVLAGDIWVDTSQQQLSIYNGSQFILVGPQTAGTSKTGPYASTVTDIYGVSHSIVVNYVDGIPMEVVTKDAFTPLTVIDGFASLNPGINVSSKYGSTFNGVATAASSLIQTIGGTQSISGNNFVRNDIPQTLNGSLSIATDGGISIGSQPTFLLQKGASYDAAFVNTYPSNGATFTFKTVDSRGSQQRLLLLDGQTSNGSHNAQATFGQTGLSLVDVEVTGALKVDYTATVNTLVVTSYISTLSNVSGNALQVNGGVGIGGTLVTTNEHILQGKLIVGADTAPTGTSIYAAVLPTQTANNSSLLTIGDPTATWNTVYARTFSGPNTVSGNITSVASNGAVTLSTTAGLSKGQLFIVNGTGGGGLTATNYFISSVNVVGQNQVTLARTLIDAVYVYPANILTFANTSLTGTTFQAGSGATFVGNLTGQASSVPGGAFNFTYFPDSTGNGGDVSIPQPQYFNGANGSGVNFLATLTNNAIYGKPLPGATTTATFVRSIPNDFDSLLVYRPLNNSPADNGAGKLYQIYKRDFLSDLYASTVATGMMMPYAGSKPDGSPVNIPGWLVCDGALYDQGLPGSTYYNLAQVLKVNSGLGLDGSVWKYGGVGTSFRVPNLITDTGQNIASSGGLQPALPPGQNSLPSGVTLPTIYYYIKI